MVNVTLTLVVMQVMSFTPPPSGDSNLFVMQVMDPTTVADALAGAERMRDMKQLRPGKWV